MIVPLTLADFLERAQGVEAGPFLLDLAVRDSLELDAAEDHLLLSGGSTQQVPFVSAAGDPAERDLVPFGHNVLNRTLEIREGRAEHLSKLFDPVASANVLRVTQIVEDAILAVQLIDGGQVPLRPELVHGTAGERLVLS